MKRVRHIVTAACAAFALIAVAGTASAAASSFTFDTYPATPTGGTVTDLVITEGSSQTTCEGRSLAFPTAKAASETLGPATAANTNCVRYVVGTPVNMTLKMNGCGLSFTAGPETAPAAGTFAIGPAGCGPIRLEEPNCTKLIGAQSGFGATYQNQGSGSGAGVRIDAKATGVAYSVEKSKANCSAGVLNYSTIWDLTAKDSAGVPTGAHLSSGVVSMKVASGSFQADKYPISVVGEQGPGTGYEEIGQHAIKLGAVELGECQKVDFSGSATGASSELGLGVTYGGCSADVLGSTLPVTVASNSCGYRFHALSGSGPYFPGSMDVTCGTPGDGIEIKVYLSAAKQEEGKTLCVMKIGAQTGVGTVNYGNITYGGAGRIAVYLELSGLSFSRQGSATCGAASGQNGTYKGESQLVGLQ